LDARDWFRCRLFPDEYRSSVFTWDQFLEWTVYVTNIQGSAMYDASLGDTALIDDLYEQARAEQSAKIKKTEKPEDEWRPPRRGYSREVEAIYDLVDNLVALRGEMGRWPATTTERVMSKRPWFPAEVVQERMRAYARHRRDTALKAAQSRWSRHHGTERG
jgi:hypothetical protein